MNTLNAFQSAPHFSSEANDLHLRCDAHESCFNPRLTSAARRTRTLAQNLKTLRFQSAPHFSSEANQSQLSRKCQTNVSIRASLQQRGEQVVGLQVGAEAEFQSAPHFSSEANGVGLPTLADIIPFQSAPHFSSEANRRGYC